MGQSTDAILVFGVDFGEDLEGLPWYDEDTGESVDFEEWYYAKLGLSNQHLWDEYYAWEKSLSEPITWPRDSVKEYEAEHPEWREALNALYEKQRQALQDCPIDVVYHCSCDYPMVIVALRDTEIVASRGYAEKIDTDKLVPNGLVKAIDFCKEHDIPFENPTWLLASNWC